jgi:RNase H-like domain found in reverse transcriptase
LGQRRGSTPLVLTELQMNSLNELKTLATSEPVLFQFDVSLPTAILVDSSDAQAGSFIAQDHGEGWVPIAFESHKLSDAETRYDIRDKEMLAVVQACKKFRHWLIGRKVKVFTEHESYQHY